MLLLGCVKREERQPAVLERGGMTQPLSDSNSRVSSGGSRRSRRRFCNCDLLSGTTHREHPMRLHAYAGVVLHMETLARMTHMQDARFGPCLHEATSWRAAWHNPTSSSTWETSVLWLVFLPRRPQTPCPIASVQPCYLAVH